MSAAANRSAHPGGTMAPSPPASNGTYSEEDCVVSVLKDTQARTDVLNRLRRAEGQIRGIHRMVEEGEDCLKIGQQFAAVRKALDSTYLRMTVCFMEQELQTRIKPDPTQQADLDHMLKDMETLLARLG